MKPELDLLNVGGCCKRAALPYATTIKAMNLDPSFPKPAVSQGNVKRWHAKDVDAWASKYKERNLV